MKDIVPATHSPSENSSGASLEMRTELAATTPAARREVAERPGPPHIPDHELICCIGRGSYGQVWLARNVMGVPRAVKIVYRDAFETDRPYEREYQGIRKFEPISRRHDSQVDILHVGRNDAAGYFYYVMELADNADRGGGMPAADRPREEWSTLAQSYSPKTLRSELKRRGFLPLDECLQIALSLTTALRHLHEHGLIHRDIKPANIIFVEGLPKLADIGLVTETGGTLTFVGTEGYLPPEGPGSAQADIFSLGKVLYELCTGKDRLEFPEMPTFIDTLPDKGRLFEFNEILLKACEQDLSKRYQNAAEMHEDLVLLKAGKSVRRSHLLERRLAMATKVAAVLAALGMVTAAALFYQRAQTERARRLADENQRLAGEETRQRQHLEFQRAHEQFERGQSSLALAHLARALRRDPADRLAAERLLSALSHRQFALPRFELTHPSTPVSARFSPDGTQVITAGKDGQARVWETATGKWLFQLQHERDLADARFSPSSRWILTRDQNGRVQVWETSTRKPAAPPLWHPLATVAEFSPNEAQVLTGGSDGMVRVWNWTAGTLAGAPMALGASLGHSYDGQLRSELKWSPDGERVLIVTEDKRVSVWEMASRRKLFDVPGYAMDLSPDGTRLAAATGLEARVWDARSGLPVSRPLWHKFPIRSVRFSPDGRRVVTASNDQTARIWDAESGTPLDRPLYHGDGLVYADFSRNGERLLTWSQDRHFRFWDARTGELAAEPTFVDLDRYASAVLLSPDERWVLVFSGSAVRLWDVRYGAVLPLTIQPAIDFETLHDNLLRFAQFDARGEKVLTGNSQIIYSPQWMRWNMVTVQAPSLTRVWSAATGQPISPQVQHDDSLSACEFSADGQWVVSASEDGTVQVWNAVTGERRTAPFQHETPVRSAAIDRDGRLVATASLDGIVRIWDASSGHLLRSFAPSAGSEIERQPNRSPFVRFSPDSSLIFASFAPSIQKDEPAQPRAWIWDVATGRPQAVLPQPRGVYYAAFSPDSSRIVTAEEDGSRARVWDARSGQAVTDWLHHQDEVSCAEFSPDGGRVVTCSIDRSARIWDSATGRLLAGPLKHGWEVLTARFNPEGSRVVTASSDQTAQIWDAATGLPVSEPIRHSDWVHTAEFSPDGRRILTAMVRQSAQIREVITPALPVPAWLPRLAEALGGQRLDDEGNSHRVSWNESVGVYAELSSIPSTVPLGQFVRWFLADRESRPISPSASVTVTELLQRRMTDDSRESLTEALRLAPLQPQILSRLGRKLMIAHRTRDTERDRAEWLTRLALQLAPQDPSVWWLRADVLQALDRLEEAQAALAKAAEMAPDNLNVLFLKAVLLHRRGDAETAYQTYLDLLETLTQKAPDQDRAEGEYLQEALRELHALGRLDPEKCARVSECKTRRGASADRIEAAWLLRKGGIAP